MKSRILAGSGSSLPDTSKDTVIGSPQLYTSLSTAKQAGTFVGDGVGLRVAKGSRFVASFVGEGVPLQGIGTGVGLRVAKGSRFVAVFVGEGVALLQIGAFKARRLLLSSNLELSSYNLDSPSMGI